jgi:DNA-binding transcriptional LysR family regulator
MVELAQLKVFVAAAEEGSFSGAAGRLHLSQSAVSQNIQGLERDLGMKLFLRQGRSVRLSEAGQAMLPLARDVLGASRLMLDAMANIQNQVVGELVVGCSTASGKYLLPGLVAAFRREHSAVRVRISILSRDEVIARLLDERLSLGVVSRIIPHHDLDYQPFFDDRVILIVPAHHPWAEYGRALPSDLLDQPLILREDGAGTTEVLLQGLAAHSISPDMLDVVMEVGNAEAIEMAVEEGIGIAFVSELAAARGLALGRVKHIEVQGLDLRRTIYMARNLRCPLTRAQESFWTFVHDQRSVLAARLKDKVIALADPEHAHICDWRERADSPTDHSK